MSLVLVYPLAPKLYEGRNSRSPLQSLPAGRPRHHSYSTKTLPPHQRFWAGLGGPRPGPSALTPHPPTARLRRRGGAGRGAAGALAGTVLRLAWARPGGGVGRGRARCEAQPGQWSRARRGSRPRAGARAGLGVPTGDAPGRAGQWARGGRRAGL